MSKITKDIEDRMEAIINKAKEVLDLRLHYGVPAHLIYNCDVYSLNNVGEYGDRFIYKSFDVAVACVLHEVGHNVLESHPWNRRYNEFRADAFAKLCGYGEILASFFENDDCYDEGFVVPEEEFLYSHPSDVDRVKALRSNEELITAEEIEEAMTFSGSLVFI